MASNSKSFLPLLLLLFANSIPGSYQNEHLSAEGTVKCFDEKTRGLLPAANLPLSFHEEETWTSDENMGITTTDGNGQFTVSGEGGDVIGGPEPYLKFENACGVEKCMKVMLVDKETKGLQIVLGSEQQEAKDGAGKQMEMKEC